MGFPPEIMKHHRFSRGFRDLNGFDPFHQEEWSGKELASALCDGLVVAEPRRVTGVASGRFESLDGEDCRK